MLLWELPYDVLLRLFNYLDGRDLAALSLCSKPMQATISQSVWRAVYKQSFGMDGDQVLGENWVSNYAARFNSKVYTWGANPDNRLGFALSYRTPHRSENRRGVNKPHLLDLSLKIRQLVSGGFSFAMLSMDGQIWLIGSLDHSLRLNHTHPRCISAGLNQQFVFISSGRHHLLALTETAKCFHISAPSIGPTMLDIPAASHVAAGWDIDAAICSGLGLIVWSKSPSNYLVVANVSSTLGPDSQLEAGQSFVMLLDDAQLLHFITVNWDSRGVDTQQLLPEKRVVKIRACFQRFAVICDDGDVFCGRYNNDRVEFSKLQTDLTFCDIALGDHHTIGLTPDGKAYVWGRESQKCGSLGLGTADDVVGKGATLERVGFNVYDIILEEPVELGLTGVMHIAAGGWQSAAVCGGL